MEQSFAIHRVFDIYNTVLLHHAEKWCCNRFLAVGRTFLFKIMHDEVTLPITGPNSAVTYDDILQFLYYNEENQTLFLRKCNMIYT